MIIFFGPAGAGKSVQGQMLAARHGWKWLSTGQLLRETNNPEILEKVKSGALIDDATANKLVDDALKSVEDIAHVVVDGFPRRLDQAKWLVEEQEKYEHAIEIVIVLEVPKSEIINRLQLRGRADDTTEAIERRLQIYRQEMYPVLGYLADKGVHIAHLDGTGTVGQVHDRIEAELESCSLV